METKAQSEPGFVDTLKLLLAVLILLGGVVGYYYFGNESVLLRAIGVLLAVAAAIWVAMQSSQGQALWKFIQASRVELRKVVWPTREDTMQTTVIVLIFAAVLGAFFWLLDLFLLWFTSFITGQGA